MSVPLEHEIVQHLARIGYRITRARRAIIRVMMTSDSSLTPQEVYDEASQLYPPLGQVTAYRTLELLSQLGYVRRTHSDGGCHRYARIGRGHRHHLTCRQCGRVEEFEGCDLSELLGRVSRQSGYSVEDHMLELSGICPRCQASERAGQSPDSVRLH